MNAREMRRPYRKYVQRIDEMERIIRFFVDEIGKIPDCAITKNRIDEFMNHESHYQLDDVEEKLQKLYAHMVKFKENNAALISEKNMSIEQREVARVAMEVLAFPQGEIGEESFEE